MKLVHVQTTVQSVFGEVDEDGDVINKKPFSLELPKLDDKTFAALADTLRKIKAGEQPQQAAPERPEAPAKSSRDDDDDYRSRK